MKTFSLYLMAVFYIVAGANHFWNPDYYLGIIPPFLPFPHLLNWASGAAEILLGILLFFPATRVYAAWGLILLLVAIFPANVYQLWAGGAGMAVPLWVLWVRLPVQGLFIWWAYSHTV
jgi:uncharacterized membrane protein